MLKNFRAYQAAGRFYHLCEALKLPRHLKDQLVRCSSSTALQLAEGYGKTSFADKRKFYVGALGEHRESQGVLDLARVKRADVIDLADHLGGMIYKLTVWRP